MRQLLFLLIFNFINLQAQNTSIVKGKIESTDGFPVSNLIIKQEKNGISIKTDEKGEFTIPNFPSGIHTLVLEGEKIKKQTKEIVVKDNEIYFVKFTLNKEINEILSKSKMKNYNPDGFRYTNIWELIELTGGPQY